MAAGVPCIVDASGATHLCVMPFYHDQKPNTDEIGQLLGESNYRENEGHRSSSGGAAQTWH